MRLRLSTIFEGVGTEVGASRQSVAASLVTFGKKDFARCRSDLAKMAELVEGIKADARDSGKCELANDAYAAEVYLSALASFAKMWEDVYAGEPRRAWDSLQDALTELQWLHGRTEDAGRYYVGNLERQLEQLEALYPYRLFSSIEVIANRSECSLCHLPPLDPRCPHVPGEVYCGEKAIIIESELEALAVSLVPNPKDKRAVIESYAEGGRNHTFSFAPVLALAERLDSPLRALAVTQGTRSAPKSEFPNLSDASRCPCLSGMEYGNCCKERATIEVPHLYVNLGDLFEVETNY
jgi:hypothetical protein